LEKIYTLKKENEGVKKLWGKKQQPAGYSIYCSEKYFNLSILVSAVDMAFK
jgi:hypothetical protein